MAGYAVADLRGWMKGRCIWRYQACSFRGLCKYELAWTEVITKNMPGDITKNMIMNITERYHKEHNTDNMMSNISITRLQRDCKRG
jgi:hypothetical protein